MWWIITCTMIQQLDFNRETPEYIGSSQPIYNQYTESYVHPLTFNDTTYPDNNDLFGDGHFQIMVRDIMGSSLEDPNEIVAGFYSLLKPSMELAF